MQYHTVTIKLHVPKLDYFFIGLIAIMLTAGTMILNVIHWLIYNTELFFDVTASFVVIGITMFMLLSRYLEGTNLQYEMGNGPEISEYPEYSEPFGGTDIVPIIQTNEEKKPETFGSLLNRVDDEHSAGIDPNSILLQNADTASVVIREASDEEIERAAADGVGSMEELRKALTESLDDPGIVETRDKKETVDDIVAEITSITGTNERDKKAA